MTEAKTLRLKVVGEQAMHCAGCESTVRFTLERIPGVRQVRADRKTQSIEVSTDEGRIDLRRILEELEWIGYRAAAE
ncbi:MAG: heavy-metal-associated domain-containing protein [Anaerolineales bacterium]